MPEPEAGPRSEAGPTGTRSTGSVPTGTVHAGTEPTAGAVNGALLELRGLRRSFDATVAVDKFSLSVQPGSFTTLLGPSGCGKTTVLRMVAGFIDPEAGAVVIDGRDQTDLPPNRRGVGMVFQDYALFPHLSVRANLEYGLRMGRVAPEARRARTGKVLESLDLTDLAERYPHQLSGGQQQRVALGRVLVLEPRVLLMDEPLSNLDAKLRLRLRSELKALQRRLGITTIYVTHDQEEALSLSDEVVVMEAGTVQQAGTPRDVYRRPANRFVASFVGQVNSLPVEVVSVAGSQATTRAMGRELRVQLPDARSPEPGTTGLAAVRPESVSLVFKANADVGAWSAPAVVESSDFYGPYERVRVRLEDAPEPWLVDVPASGAADTVAPGTPVSVSLAPESVFWLW